MSKGHGYGYDDEDDTAGEPPGRFVRDRPDVYSSDDPELAAAFGAPPPEALHATEPPRRRITHRPPPGPPRHPGREAVIVAHLRQAGMRASFTGNDIYVDGKIVGEKTRTALARYKPDSQVDITDLIGRFAPGLLKNTARHELKQAGYGLWPRPAKREIDVMRGREPGPVARITCRSLTTAGGEHLEGPFYLPGAHWEQARELLLPDKARKALKRRREREQQKARRAAEAARSPVAPRPARRPVDEPKRLREFPADAPEHLRRMALEATERLRDRQRADEDSITTNIGPDSRVTLHPIEREGGVFLLPFTISRADSRFGGRIYIKSPRVPLMIDVTRHDPDIPLAWAWAVALHVAAGRLCNPPSAEKDDHRQPVGFRPDARTREVVRHRVPAHRRRLGERNASIRKLEEAEEVGIDLGPHETWVKSHSRGGHLDEPLRFEWTGRRIPDPDDA